MIDVEHRRERHIDAVRAQLGSPSRNRAIPPTRHARNTSRSHNSPSRRIGGKRVNPSRKRCTRPPSWSTAINSGGVAQRVNLAAQFGQAATATRSFALNRITMPTSGCAQPLAVGCGQRLVPSTPIATGPSMRSSFDYFSDCIGRRVARSSRQPKRAIAADALCDKTPAVAPERRRSAARGASFRISTARQRIG